jgi:hypothetical protein
MLDLLKCGNLHNFRVSRVSCFCAFRVFVHFAFSHILRVSHFCTSHIFHVSDSSRFHASHILRMSRNPTQFVIHALTYLAGFAFPHISHSRVFRASTCATARLPGIHRIPFTCLVLILQGPLVRISLCFTCITSYMSLHSHLCSFISLCVYITSPCMFSATYLAPRPGNSLSMLTRQRIVRGFYFTSDPSLRQLVRRT